MVKAASEFTKQWILDTGIPIVESYEGNLTLRALHYRLVAAGMTNDTNHYKRVVAIMAEARWKGLVAFDAFLDHERETIGLTRWHETTVEDAVETAKNQIKNWANYYSKNRWENQPNYVEVLIEKKALQGVFERPCRKWDVALNPCKGYPSLTFQYEIKRRFDHAIMEGKFPIILYFGDYDCSGEDIPRSIVDTLGRMGTEVELKRIALMEHQVIDWNLPPAPSKSTDTRSRTWDGLGQVELDAVEPPKIVELCENAIAEYFDANLYEELQEQEQGEKIEFRRTLKTEILEVLNG